MTPGDGDHLPAGDTLEELPDVDGGVVCGKGVVKYDETTRANEWVIQLKVSSKRLESMVAVQKQEVQRSAVKELAHQLEGADGTRVHVKDDPGGIVESPQLELLCGVELDADDHSGIKGVLPNLERPTVVATDLEDVLRLLKDEDVQYLTKLLMIQGGLAGVDDGLEVYHR